MTLSCLATCHLYSHLQERDRLASAADTTSRMRYKNQEVAQKEEQLATILSSRRAKLDALLGTRGGGKCQR